MSNVLLIVHLSCLDDYVFFYDTRKLLAKSLVQAILFHPGPIVVMDELNPISRRSRARLEVYDALVFREDVTLFRHDESVYRRVPDAWTKPIDKLSRLLTEKQANICRLGGLYTSINGVTGCVNQTARQLVRRGHRAALDFSISGLDEPLPYRLNRSRGWYWWYCPVCKDAEMPPEMSRWSGGVFPDAWTCSAGHRNPFLLSSRWKGRERR